MLLEVSWVVTWWSIWPKKPLIHRSMGWCSKRHPRWRIRSKSWTLPFFSSVTSKISIFSSTEPTHTRQIVISSDAIDGHHQSFCASATLQEHYSSHWNAVSDMISLQRSRVFRLAWGWQSWQYQPQLVGFCELVKPETARRRSGARGWLIRNWKVFT